MRIGLILAVLFLLTGIFSAAAVQAQTNADVGIRATLAGGEVVSAGEGKILLKTKDGDIEVILSEATEYKRIPPENPVLRSAVASTLSEIGVGDNLLVTGTVSADKKKIPAKAVYLISKSDIAKKQAKEAEEWRTRGITGRVVNFNPQTNVITVSVRGLMGERTVQVTPKTGAEFFRYAPDSINFSDALKSSIADIEAGDSIRVLGDRNADGSEVQAEKIVTGAFRTVGGTIKAIDAEKNEITITDFQTRSDVTIVVGGNTVLKQFPAEMAQRMAQSQPGGGQGMMRPPQGGQPNRQPTSQQGQSPNATGQGGGMMRAGGGLDDMLDRFPNINVADLKVGEMIAVSSTKGADPGRVRAIKLLSGVEPFIRMQQAAGARPGGGGRGADSGFSIPGLDGFGTP